MTLHQVIMMAVLVAIAAALELTFGINDTGCTIALVLLVWGCMSIPVSLAVARFIKNGGGND